MTFDVHAFDVHESDRPGADTVLLSAGLGGAAGYWAPQLAALKARYRVITYDQAGTGRARATQLPAGYAIADMATQVLEILDETATTSCHVVGHALGGLVGVDLALRQPGRVRTLTIVNGWASADAHTRRCFEIRVALLKGAGPEAYVRAQPIFLYPATGWRPTPGAWKRRMPTRCPASRAATTCCAGSRPCCASMPQRGSRT